MSELSIAGKKHNKLLWSIGLLFFVLCWWFCYFFTETSQEFTLAMLGLGGLIISWLILLSVTNNPFSSIGFAYIVVLSMTHGLGWFLAKIFKEQHYSIRVQSTDITYAYGVAFAGIGMFLFILGYAYYITQNRKKNRFSEQENNTKNHALLLVRWDVLIVWLVAILAFELLGGMGVFQELVGTLNYIYRSLFGYMVELVIILFSLKVLAYFKKKAISYLALVSIWGIYIFLVGRRQYIIPIILITFVLSSKWNISKVSFVQAGIIALIVISFIFGLMYFRVSVGREALEQPLIEQLDLMQSNRSAFSVEELREDIEYDLGYRLNASNVLIGLLAEKDINSIWLEPYSYAVTMSIPSILWPAKTQNLNAGELASLISNKYNLPVTDYISTAISTFYATGGIPLLAISMFLFGLMIAYFDNRFEDSNTLWSCILAVGIGYGVLQPDHSIDLWLLELRHAIVLGLCIYFTTRFRIRQIDSKL